MKAHSPFLVSFLSKNGYAVSEAQSTDHLVALCLSNRADAVILDVDHLGEIEGWSVAQSIKMAKPYLPVILLSHGGFPENVELPSGVDAVATDSDLPGLVAILTRHTASRNAVNE